MRKLAISLSLLIASGLLSAGAQEERSLQTVTVTASRIDADDLQTAPAVFRRIPADFVLVEVNFQSGSRDVATRKRELETMFKRLKTSVSGTAGYELFGGDIGESSAPIDTVLFEDVYQNYSNQGQFSLTLSIDTKRGETFDLLVRPFSAGLRARDAPRPISATNNTWARVARTSTAQTSSPISRRMSQTSGSASGRLWLRLRDWNPAS